MIFKHLIILFFIHHATSQFVPDKIVNAFNAFRRAAAKAMNIANMYELTYDDDLEEDAKDIANKGCGREAYTGPGRVMRMTDNQAYAQELQKHMAGVLRERKPLPQETAIEIFHPLQTEIGCTQIDCTSGGAVFRLLCILGPETTFDLADFKSGMAGSECDGDDEDGLCSSTIKVGSLALSFVFVLAIQLVF